VQSKATERPFDAETANGFDLRCNPRDVDYWLNGNTPVILIQSRPSTDEAYWVDVKKYFSNLDHKKSGKIRFDKITDRFDETASAALERLATAAAGTISSAARQKKETIYSNLLRVGPLPQHYFVARTEYRTPQELFARLHELVHPVRGEWLLQGRNLISF